jgi:hypothetical protein
MIPDRRPKVEMIADFIRRGLRGADPFSQEQLLAYRRVLDARQQGHISGSLWRKKLICGCCTML